MQGENQPAHSWTPAGFGRARPLPSAVALLCLFTSTTAAALGLGGAEVASRLNQPLDARIPLHDVGPGGIEAIEVGLASRARLRDAGLDGARYLDRLRFSVEAGAAGAHHVRVTSEGPIAEPFLRFLLRVDTGQGRVIRDYTLLLDPPMLATGDAPPAPTESPAPAATAGPEGPPADTAAPGPGTWGPVATGSSAWEVAAAVRADDVSIYQAMVALLRANPGAFHDGDLGGLKAGTRLTVPPPAEMRAIPQAEAVAVYREHLGTVAAAAEAAPADDAGNAGDANNAAGPVVVRQLPALSLIRSADAARGDAGAAPPAGEADAGPRLPVRLDERLGDIAGAVDAVGERVAAEGDNVARALSSQSGQLDRVEELLAGVQQDVAALREARPSAAAAAPAAAAGGLSYRAGVLLALAGLLLGGLGGYAAGRAGRGLPARHATPAGAPAAATVPAASGHDDGPVPAAAGQQRGRELPAGRAAAETPPSPAASPEISPAAPPETPPVTGEPVSAQTPEMGVSELEWDPSEDVAGPSSSEDDHLFWADIYIAENLPREAEKIIRDAIALYGERPGYRVKLLEALYNAGAREQYLREATRYRRAAIDEGTWDEVVRMGRTLAPDHPPFSGAAASADAEAPADGDIAGADAGAGEGAAGAEVEPGPPDLAELDDAIGGDADGGPADGTLLWDASAPPDRPDDEAAAELDLDPLEVDPEASPENRAGQPGAASPGAGDEDARGSGADAGDDDRDGEGDDYRKVAGRR